MSRPLPGGHPFERCLVVAVHAEEGPVFVGALLQDRHGLLWIEVTGRSEQRFGRASLSSPLVQALGAGRVRGGLPAGHLELDLLVRDLARDPEGFWARAARDAGISVVDAHPRAICLARWGHKGDRAVKLL